jgi:phytoene desaturase
MNGYRTHIFEQHNLPGGVCTAWKRKGYTIDGCIHWLMGSRPGSSLYRMYEEVGALQGNRLLIRDHWGYYVDEVSGKSIDITADLDRLEADLQALAPEDGPAIGQLMAGIRGLRGADLPMDKAREVMGPLDNLKMAWAARRYLRHLATLRISVGEFTQSVQSPFLRWLLTALMPGQMPLGAILLVLGALADGTLATVEGGSLRFAQAMERRYKALGGALTYGADVQEILVENGRAVGVRLSDGSRHRADYVVSAADGYSTIFKMLGGRYVDAEIRERYETWALFDPLIFVSLGVASTLAGRPLEATIGLRRPFTVAGKRVRQFSYRLFNNDPTLAPPGKTVVQVLIETDYDYWNELYGNRRAYEADKARIADEVLDRLEAHLPGIWTRVEMVDVATPCTLERYTRNRRAAYEGWMVTPKTFSAQISRTLPGLSHFYMVGQWVQPGGDIPPAVAHGRHIAQILCRQDGKKFVATA